MEIFNRGFAVNWLSLLLIVWALYLLITGNLLTYVNFSGFGKKGVLTNYNTTSNNSTSNNSTGNTLTDSQAISNLQNSGDSLNLINNSSNILPPNFSSSNFNLDPPSSTPQPLPPLPSLPPNE